uniref:Uncharacterized protein n=1 Tax=Chromera velia CCMP2878 TaxID=1169474 RepID=A0A0G4I9D6_9ALVE|eukprot:Cvel_12234.t1-p1 / transcript=Cvel_12234.t1 / gene=Cvel_12234 / organism=Chromera_velia_CCMP2878 / gene_product=hypothetical protein / transcript_product=hypothetical protein / location=Cvel_scaffold792:42225-45038(+) / protein_length=479 / sequence_SO=supercontig / SO=protein_coding / is_pseudo=false
MGRLLTLCVGAFFTFLVASTNANKLIPGLACRFRFCNTPPRRPFDSFGEKTCRSRLADSVPNQCWFIELTHNITNSTRAPGKSMRSTNETLVAANETSVATTPAVVPQSLRRAPVALIQTGAQVHETSSTKAKGTSKSKVKDNVKSESTVFEEPSVLVKVIPEEAPDVSLKTKMDDLEEFFSREEYNTIRQGETELNEITSITATEIRKAIAVQLAPFDIEPNVLRAFYDYARILARKGARPGVCAAVPKIRAGRPKNEALREDKPPGAFGQVTHGILDSLQTGNASKAVPDFSGTFAVNNLTEEHGVSLLQTSSKTSAKSTQKAQSGTTSVASRYDPVNFGLNRQLNVKVAQSSKPYPTIDELVEDMEVRRMKSENLARMKILQTHSRLMKAQQNMLKEALHYGLNEVMGKYGAIITAIKTELLPFTMGIAGSPARRISLFKSDYDLRKYIKYNARKSVSLVGRYAKRYAEEVLNKIH